jgi:uncharacterized protein
MKNIIGMIHLATGVEGALREILIYQRHGLAGALVENYHGSIKDVECTLASARAEGVKIPLGVNILPNEFAQAFAIANKYGAEFIQLDHVAGTYDGRGTLDAEHYLALRSRYSHIRVLGGVWPKYYSPIGGSDLGADIRLGCERADVLVVTGQGTGQITPLEKIAQFRSLSSRPLYIGAGITAENAAEQLLYADGAVIGSYFKDGDICAPVNERRVAVLMKSVSDLPND